MINLAQSDVLLVEDDPNDVLLIRRAFSRAKLLNPLHIVNDGDSAIDYLAGVDQYGDRDRHPLPALILLDLKLPRRSGLEVLEWLKQQPELRRLPVVVLTSSRENIDINRAYDLNANSYLVKPVAPDALLEMVKMLDLYWLTLNEKPNVENG
ncbi:response regulator [Oculatella sp. FACHB-28]|uniref:response regulator n=1 Tax=Cyanophyceae TaxID=3028117 RepID=UPI001683CBB4|nr:MULTISPECIES: response regulator [Cyanophyceae]MBD2000725.1 response regulator [Leptolyngbya sp. FACHB-541]MBD2056815.1 response regulator [Oculatella sp. FACHB-28]